MDHCKVFDSIEHELVTAKLNAHGLILTPLLKIYSYISRRKQKLKLNGSYSSW